MHPTMGGAAATGESDPAAVVLLDRARSAGVVCESTEASLPASHNAYLMQIESTLRAFGSAVRAVHRVDIEGVSPQRQAIDHQWIVEYLGSMPTDGASALSGAYAHMSASELLDVVVAGHDMVAARSEATALAQGAPTLDNLRMVDGDPCGFADWSAMRVADRHWDLAIACRNVLGHCGPAAVSAVIDAYGFESVDPVRLDWYSHVVELLSQRV